MSNTIRSMVGLSCALWLVVGCERAVDLGKDGVTETDAGVTEPDSGPGQADTGQADTGQADTGLLPDAKFTDGHECKPETCNGLDDDCDGVVDDGCECAEHEVECDGSCVELAIDVKHCGACGVTCAAGQICVGGKCEEASSQGACTPGMDQTCNDSPQTSALMGACQPDGTCVCQGGYGYNPVTGRCRKADDCTKAIDDLAAEMKGVEGWSAVVRLDHDTLAIKGFELFAAKYTGVSEAAARATAQQDSGHGSTGTMLHGGGGDDHLFVFYESPGDFGGVAVVSKQNGLSVFGGGIVWLGAGDITYPKAWRPVAELGSNCPIVGSSSGGPIKVTGLDLVQGGASLADAQARAAAMVAGTTALPAAMWKKGYVFDIVVLRYPRTVGGFDPKTAEYIVILNGGWLE